MKIRIEADDFVGADGKPVKRGAEFTVESGAVPADWSGKVAVVNESAPEAKPITNPKAKS